MPTIRTIRARLTRALRREHAAWVAHDREMRGSCLSDCEDLQRWGAYSAALREAFEAAGARWPRWADRGGWEPRRRSRAARVEGGPPPLDQAPVPVVAGSADACVDEYGAVEAEIAAAKKRVAETGKPVVVARQRPRGESKTTGKEGAP